MTKKIATSVLKKKNISEGLKDFICKEYKYIAYLFDGLQIVKYAVPELKDIPDGPQIISTFRNHYRKRFFLFIIFFALYSLLIMVTKFILFRM